MGEARKHHFISRFLLRGFAVPEEDNGRLFVLDQTRNSVYQSSPANSGHRRDFHRVDKDTHPDPLVVEDFYAKIESRAAPALREIRTKETLPPRAEAAKVLDLIAIHLVRTPRFRKWMEGKFFEAFEGKISEFGRNKASRRRFARKQCKYGMPDDCLTPEGFIARLKSGDFSVTTDDNWKIALAMQSLPLFVEVLQSRHWLVMKFPDTFEPLIICDTAVGLLAVGEAGPNVVGLALPNTIVYLPISTRLVLVGVYPQTRSVLESGIRPRLLNTTSFAFSLDQCFSSDDDVVIDDPERGPTQWTTYQSEGHFPKLFDDACDLADDYEGGS